MSVIKYGNRYVGNIIQRSVMLRFPDSIVRVAYPNNLPPKSRLPLRSRLFSMQPIYVHRTSNAAIPRCKLMLQFNVILNVFVIQNEDVLLTLVAKEHCFLLNTLQLVFQA